jgi:nicotinate-nucleotide adenylyltransferase
VPVSRAPVDFASVPPASHRSATALRIGLFGGTFDPPHVGHLVAAVNVRHALGLDRVVLMVANTPWQKEGSRPISPASDRLALVAAAVSGIDGLEAGDLELRRSGPTYTADTLAELSAAHPDAEIFTVLGHDAAVGIHTWERVDEVVGRSRLVVVERPAVRGSSPAPLPDDVDWIHVEVPLLEISSSDIRSRVVEGRPLDFLVPDAVREEIVRRGLYRDGDVHTVGAA